MYRKLAAALAAAGLTAATPAGAIERIELRLPLLDTSFTAKVAELRDTRRLLNGNSDLAELDQATNGMLGRRIVEVFQAPLPLQIRSFANQAVGSPLLNQALLIVSALGQVDGVPNPLDSAELAATLDRAAARGPLTLVDVLEAMPGKTITVDLERFFIGIRRLQQQQQTGDRLVAVNPAAGIDPSLIRPGALAIQRRELSIKVSHRPVPLQVVVITPEQGANGRLAVISHGLWDSPESFEGWASHLASHGYSVLLPRHPGSDSSQQQAMLAGKAPPPSPEDLRLRPLDVVATIDAAAAGKLGLPAGVRTDAVVALGQSWGATTVLQLAGARPSAGQLQRHCGNLNDPARNLSWVLQCSFLKTANQAAVADPRVKAVVAVSPVMRLLFDTGAGRGMNARVLLVSGSRDWVVPSGPEAIEPMAAEARNVGGGHRLVLAKGGDHFNLRSPLAEAGGPLRGLILAWVNGAFAAGAAAAPAPGAPNLLPPDGWGDTTYPLVDVTPALRQVSVKPQ
jgi:predicted dienelactone hydrolase